MDNTRVLNVAQARYPDRGASRWMVAPSHSGSAAEGHQFVEKIVTLCVRAARADKATIEVDVVADDANHAAVRRAVEHRIEAVSSIARERAGS